MYIASQDELAAFVQRSKNSDVLAIESVIIDPFAVDDLRIVCELFEDENIVKIFHAGHQDLEIMFYDLECLPHPIFDTQVAASLLGQTQQIGYAPLVSSVCGVKLKKMDSFTDWSSRPLTDSQLQYALDDVIYLPQMYDKMREDLLKKGRLDWLQSDFEDMSKPETYQEDERERFRKLKHVMQLNRRQMAAAREMASWREIEARKRNVPRKWVMTDEQIVEACKREPRKIDDLFMVRGIRERITTRDARVIVELTSAALDSSPEAWPEIPQPGKSERNVDANVDLLMAIVRLRARDYDIAIPTLASHSDLVKIARGHYENVDILKGWRRELIGEELVDLLEGRLSLSIEDGHVSVSKN